MSIAPLAWPAGSFAILPEKLLIQFSLRVRPAYKPVELVVGMTILNEAKTQHEFNNKRSTMQTMEIITRRASHLCGFRLGADQRTEMPARRCLRRGAARRCLHGDVCTTEPRHHGTMEPRNHRTTESWNHGTTEPQHHGTTAPWNHGTTAPRHHGTEPLCPTLVALWLGASGPQTNKQTDKRTYLYLSSSLCTKEDGDLWFNKACRSTAVSVARPITTNYHCTALWGSASATNTRSDLGCFL